MIEAYLANLLILVCIYAIVALGLNLAIGRTGLLNLGHVAFFCIGAYASALLALLGFPFLVCFLVSALIAMTLGYILGLLTSNLKKEYFTIASFAFFLVVYTAVLNWRDLTRGPLGIPGIPSPRIGFIEFDDSFQFLLLALMVLLISAIFIRRLVHSRYGLVMASVRDNNLTSEILGKDVFKVKTQVLMVSAFFAGLGGSLYAHYISFIDPYTFGFSQMILLLTIVILGGMTSLRGTIIATILLLLLPEPLRFIDFPLNLIGPARTIIYSVVLLAIIFYKPQGLFGETEFD